MFRSLLYVFVFSFTNSYVYASTMCGSESLTYKDCVSKLRQAYLKTDLDTIENIFYTIDKASRHRIIYSALTANTFQYDSELTKKFVMNHDQYLDFFSKSKKLDNSTKAMLEEQVISDTLHGAVNNLGSVETIEVFESIMGKVDSELLVKNSHVFRELINKAVKDKDFTAYEKIRTHENFPSEGGEVEVDVLYDALSYEDFDTLDYLKEKGFGIDYAPFRSPPVICEAIATITESYTEDLYEDSLTESDADSLLSFVREASERYGAGSVNCGSVTVDEYIYSLKEDMMDHIREMKSYEDEDDIKNVIGNANDRQLSFNDTSFILVKDDKAFKVTQRISQECKVKDIEDSIRTRLYNLSLRHFRRSAKKISNINLVDVEQRKNCLSEIRFEGYSKKRDKNLKIFKFSSILGY